MATKEENGKDIANSQNGDAEQHEEKLKYPRAIPFIISNELCERFNYYGMRTILVLYLTRQLNFSDDTATILYHSFTTLVYFFCILGAIIADSWWGKFHTIFWLSLVYVSGSVVVTLGSIEPWNMPATTFTIIGLLLIAFGSGGIKPCVAAFGGEQFKMPQQAKHLALFFSLFYFAINLGSFISTLVTPILRERKCFGMETCFPLGFGLPAALMAVSVVIFLAGKFLYKRYPPQGNMFLKVCKCIGNAISTKGREKNTNPKEHWLDYAENKYGKKLVKETRILLNVLVLYLPLPLFWALFDQQGSRWTFQATRMDGDLGWYTIKPDQMQVVNPLLILTFIPLFEIAFYPLLSLIGIRRPLQKITLGGIFAGIAFVCSMVVEINLEKTYPVIPKSGEAQIRIFNGVNCDYSLNLNLPEAVTNERLEPNSYFVRQYVNLDKDEVDFSYSLTTTTAQCTQLSGSFGLKSATATSFLITGPKDDPTIEEYEDDPEKSSQGTPMIRLLTNFLSDHEVYLEDKDGKHEPEGRNKTDVPANKHDVFVGTQKVLEQEHLRLGGYYTILIQETSSGNYLSNIFIVTEPNSMNMLWLLPQYIIMTLGEVMYSVTGLQFSYTQAPESMRSVLQGCWQLTVAFGNLITTIIVGASIFKRQTFEFALFAGLMFLDMIIFMWLGIRYKAIPLSELDDIDEEERQKALDAENEKKGDSIEFPGSSREAKID